MAKNSLKRKIAITTVMHQILGTVWHMIIIFGKFLLNDISRSFFQFFKNLIFWPVRGVKGQKIAKKKLHKLHTISPSSIAYDHDFWYISQEIFIVWLSITVHFCKMMISSGGLFFFFFFFLQNFNFLDSKKQGREVE